VIEALIGHMKNDGLLDRNWLKGKVGDALHVVLCAAGQNLRLILRAMKAFLRAAFGSSQTIIQAMPIFSACTGLGCHYGRPRAGSAGDSLACLY
jgi:hypothetical protein